MGVGQQVSAVGRCGGSRLAALICAGVLGTSAGCPDASAPPSIPAGTSSRPPTPPAAEESGSPSGADDTGGVPPDVCAELMGAAPDGAENAPLDFPKLLRDTATFRWFPETVVVRWDHSSIFVNAENRTTREVEIEYEAVARMLGGSRETALPIDRQTIGAAYRRYHRIDLQFGAAVGVLHSGAAEVSLRARLTKPHQTAFEDVGLVQVSLRVDGEGRVRDVTYERVNGEPV